MAPLGIDTDAPRSGRPCARRFAPRSTTRDGVGVRSSRPTPWPSGPGAGSALGPWLLENGTVNSQKPVRASAPGLNGAGRGRSNQAIPKRRQASRLTGWSDAAPVAGTSQWLAPAALNRSSALGHHDLDGEFDPGSGRTLAARFIHASRAGSIGLAREDLAANGCVTREQPAPKTGISRRNLV